VTTPHLRAHVTCSQGHPWTESMAVDVVSWEWRLKVNETICPECGRAALKLRGVEWMTP